MPERELPEATQSIEEFGTRMHEMAEVARKAAEGLEALMKAATPQTKEEWAEAYFELYERYQRLARAAEDVIAGAMPVQGDNTEQRAHRRVVSTRALDALRAEAFADRTEGGA